MCATVARDCHTLPIDQPQSRCEMVPKGLYVLDHYGNPVPDEDFVHWANWREQHHDDVQVARTVIEHPTDGRITVLTVFTGRDHRWVERPETAPILFETLVFGGPSGLQGERERYATISEAREGHQVVCQSVINRSAEDRVVVPMRQRRRR